MLLATVKGDVHDIGKNIVGVVLGCNDYEVIDLGVMVPAEKILDTAEREGVDVVGLSGLITPSLDEMVDVAREMERRGLELPLLIGGATTSTPAHGGEDRARVRATRRCTCSTRARVVDVVSQLLDPKRRAALDVENRELQERLRVQHAEKEPQAAAAARRRRARTACSVRFDDLPAPPFLGAREVEPPLAELVQYIDWQFFFHAWDLKGKFPAILDQPGRARALRRRARRSSRDRPARGAAGARCLRLLAGARRGRRRRLGDDALLLPAPAGRPRRRAAEPLARRLRRARRTTTSAPSPSRSTAPTSSPRGTSRSARRLQRDRGQGAG